MAFGTKASRVFHQGGEQTLIIFRTQICHLLKGGYENYFYSEVILLGKVLTSIQYRKQKHFTIPIGIFYAVIR